MDQQRPQTVPRQTTSRSTEWGVEGDTRRFMERRPGASDRNVSRLPVRTHQQGLFSDWVSLRERCDSSHFKLMSLRQFRKAHWRRGRMIRVSLILITPLLFLCVSASGFQDKGGRETTPKGGGPGHSVSRTPKPKPKASLLVNVTPSDSTIILNDEIQRGENGSLDRTGLAPGNYRLVVQREGYESQALQISLTPDTNTPFNVVLKLITGDLNIEPSVSGCQIR